jgi:multiple sugar transport system substrate-binding protein
VTRTRSKRPALQTQQQTQPPDRQAQGFAAVAARSLRRLPRGRRLYLGLGAVAAVVVLVAGSLVAGFWPRGAGATHSAGPTATPTGTPAPIEVRWFVGLGTGTAPEQVAAERAFVVRYNQSQSDIELKLEVIPSASAYDVLKTEIASGNPPDIVGPVGTGERNGFGGIFLDLTQEIASHQYDTGIYEPAAVRLLVEGSDGQVGLPYLIYPGFIFYNRDLLRAAGLPDLPTKVGETYQGRTWDWDELAAVAAQLTVDTAGRRSTQSGYSYRDTFRFGLAFDMTDARRVGSSFGGGSFVGPDGRTAQIPDVWREAWAWYLRAMSDQGVVMPANWSPIGPPLSFVTLGRIGMMPAWPWGLNALYWPSYSSMEVGDQAARPDRILPQAAGSPAASPTPSPVSTPKVAAYKSWGMAVMPSWKGQTSSPMDVDTFTIPRSSAHPDQAFEAMTAIMADTRLRAAFDPHGMPGLIVDQPAWISAMDAEQAALFPGNQVSWSVLQEMAKHPAMPSHQADMPNARQAVAHVDDFYQELRRPHFDDKGNEVAFDLDAALDDLQLKLQADFDAVLPPLQSATPKPSPTPGES